MNKIFLMFILTFTFLDAEIIKNLSALKHKTISSPFCVSSYNLIPTYREFWVYSYSKPAAAPTKITFTQQDIQYFNISGYEWDTIKATCTLSPIPPPPPPPPPAPTGPTGPTGPTNPTNPPITITPDENGLIMGLTPQNYHFSLALWGVALSFLMAIGLILSF